jgi:hypothetical protein
MKAVVSRLGVVALAAALLVAGCSGDGETNLISASTAAAGSSLVKVGDFSAAVEAVEDERGEGQRYVEINATPEGVNVFVAVDDTDEVSYFFTEGGLEPAGEPTAQTSTPFTLDGVDLALGERLVDETHERFPGANVVSVALLQLPEGLRWALRSRSIQGGLLNLLFTPTGQLVSVAPA